MTHLPIEHPELLDLKNALTQAAKVIITKIDELYPIGSIIEANMGTARIRMEVTGTKLDSWCPLHETTYIYGKNIKTGKPRKLSVTSDSHEIITLSRP